MGKGEALQKEEIGLERENKVAKLAILLLLTVDDAFLYLTLSLLMALNTGGEGVGAEHFNGDGFEFS